MKNLENQVAQIAKTLIELLPGTLPSNTEVTPKESLKAITLRSGKELSFPLINEPKVEVVASLPRAEQPVHDRPNVKVDSGERPMEKRKLNCLNINQSSLILLKLKGINKKSNTRNFSMCSRLYT